MNFGCLNAMSCCRMRVANSEMTMKMKRKMKKRVVIH